MSDTTVKKKSVKKKSALNKHLDNECGCSILSNPNNCIYQQFIDGWNFTPDVGNGQKRGEVFTPRFIVDKMVKDIGIFPHDAVYEQNYSTVDKDEIEKIISSKVLEPAVGTGNYISTVLWHKLMFVEEFAKDNKGVIDKNVYHQQLLKAVSSIYIFDIDCGNLETTYQRLFKLTETMNGQSRIDYWTETIEKTVESDLTNIDVEKIALDSLTLAEENWSKFTNSSNGIVTELYKKHIGEEIPENIGEKVVEILNNNIKLFNGIQKEDDVSESFICPGWKNVVWNWWNVNEDCSIDYETVRLADQMLSGQIEQLEKQIADLKNEHMVEKFDGLFGFDDWDTPESKKKHDQIVKELNKLKKELNNQ